MEVVSVQQNIPWATIVCLGIVIALLVWFAIGVIREKPSPFD